MSNIIDNSAASSTWDNKDNSAFYSTLPLTDLKIYAYKSGLDQCADLNLLQNYFMNATSILEIGAGYGRVIEYILNHQYQGKMTALERCKRYCHFLRNRFEDRIEVLERDILSLQINKKFDLALWMWNGIYDFPAHQQTLAISLVASALTDGGYCIIDTVTLDEDCECEDCQKPFYSEFVGKYGIHKQCYLKTKELKDYCQCLGLQYIGQITYFAAEWKKILHILKK